MNNAEVDDDDDPFAVFDGDGDDDDEDEDEPGAIAASISTTPAVESRDEIHNGPMSFHQGTEQALLLYVQQHLRCNDNANDNDKSKSTSQSSSRAQRVLQLVDDFCFQRHWMMHIGPEKGQFLQDFLRARFQLYMDEESSSASSLQPPFIVVELGTYCGYSAVSMLETMRQECVLRHKGTTAATTMALPFHLITVDVSAPFQAVARQLLNLASTSNNDDDDIDNGDMDAWKMADHVSYILLDEQDAPNPDKLGTLVQTKIQQLLFGGSGTASSATASANFVFIDHAKEMYLPHLQALERARLVQAGTAVAADNVVVFDIQDYRQYVAQHHASAGVVQTQLRMGHLEYLQKPANGYAKTDNKVPTQEFQDGLECTVYLQDPPLMAAAAGEAPL